MQRWASDFGRGRKRKIAEVFPPPHKFHLNKSHRPHHETTPSIGLRSIIHHALRRLHGLARRRSPRCSTIRLDSPFAGPDPMPRRPTEQPPHCWYGYEPATTLCHRDESQSQPSPRQEECDKRNTVSNWLDWSPRLHRPSSD